jgi:hypothetical protein
MNLQEFKEEYSGAPINVVELACSIIDHLDLDGDITHDLYHSASSFISAYNTFTRTLFDANIELG